MRSEMSSVAACVLVACLFSHAVTADAISNELEQHNILEAQNFKNRRRSEVLEHLRAGRRTRRSFACDGCLVNATTGVPQTVKVMYIGLKDTVENLVAAQAAKDEGSTNSCEGCCFDASKAHPQCFAPANWNTGWIAKPVLRLLQNTGANIVAMTAANLSAEAVQLAGTSNAYTACGFEIVLGNVDLCVGDFWETESARNIVAFTTPLDVNHMKLITTAVEKNAFGPNRLLDIFLPFTPAVWVTMMGMFIFTAILMWIVAGEESEDFADEEIFPRPLGIVKGFWVAMMGYLAGNQFTADKWSTRLIVLGFSFFLAISIASYTANLASFMVLKPRAAGAVQSLKDIVMRSKKLCAVDLLSSMLTEPGIQERVVLAPNGFMGSLFEQMYMGHCDAALVGKTEYRLYIQAESMQYDICTTKGDPNFAGGWYCEDPASTLTRFDLTKCQCENEPAMEELPEGGCPADCHAPNSKFCNVIEVNDPDLDVSVNYALPVADWLEPYISAGIIAAKVSGDFSNDLKTELIDKNPPSCPTGTPQYSSMSEGGEDAMALGVDSMAGTFVFSTVLMIFGLLLHLVQALVLRRRNGAEEEAGDEDERERREAPTLKPPAFIKTEQDGSKPEQEQEEAASSDRSTHALLEAKMEARLAAIEQNLSRLVEAVGDSRGGPGRGSFRDRGSFRKSGQGGSSPVAGRGGQRQGDFLGGFLSFQPWR